jgi:hypothetical protein
VKAHLPKEYLGRMVDNPEVETTLALPKSLQGSIYSEKDINNMKQKLMKAFKHDIVLKGGVSVEHLK